MVGNKSLSLFRETIYTTMNKINLVLTCLLSLLVSKQSFSQNEFITEWVTNDGQISILTSAQTTLAGESVPYSYNYSIEWYNKETGMLLGSAQGVDDSYTITNLPMDTIEVRISGVFPHLYSAYNNNAQKLIHVKQWGAIQWKSFRWSFSGCSNLETVATTSPDLSQVRDMEALFYYASVFNSDISAWDVSNVTNMRELFSYASAFNQDLSTWDVSNVTNMRGMFTGATVFNSDLSTWDVSHVEDMLGMFAGATSFNQDISNWDVSNVIEMAYMFRYCAAFNQDLSSWDLSSANYIQNMFEGSNISYCNMDNIINSWAPTILSKELYLTNVPQASINSAEAQSQLIYRLYVVSIIEDVVNVTIDSDETTICEGNETILTAQGATTYVWNTSETTNEITVAPTETTTYTVLGTDASGCQSSSTIEIEVNTLPTVTLSSASTTICSGSETSITADGALSYVWNTQETTDEITVSPTETTLYTAVGTDINGCSATASIEIEVNSCLTIENNSFEVSIHPNPVTDYLSITIQNIDFSTATISLMDITGKEVKVENLSTESTTISLSELPTGVYFITVQSNDTQLTKKIVKQ